MRYVLIWSPSAHVGTEGFPGWARLVELEHPHPRSVPERIRYERSDLESVVKPDSEDEVQDDENPDDIHRDLHPRLTLLFAPTIGVLGSLLYTM